MRLDLLAALRAYRIDSLDLLCSRGVQGYPAYLVKYLILRIRHLALADCRSVCFRCSACEVDTEDGVRLVYPGYIIALVGLVLFKTAGK